MVQRLARSPLKPESDHPSTALSNRISGLLSIQEVTADARRCPSGAIWVQFAPLDSPSLEKAALSIHRLEPRRPSNENLLLILGTVTNSPRSANPGVARLFNS